MSPKNTSKVPENQLTFFDLVDKQSIADERPHPIVVADKHGFSLAHIDQTGNPDDYLYNLREWFTGLMSLPYAEQVLKDARRGKGVLKDLVDSIHEIALQENGKRGRPRKEMFAKQEILYEAVQRMSNGTENNPRDLLIVNEVRKYLAKCGVWVDKAKRNPDQAAHELQSAADNRYTKRLQEHGYSSEQIPALLEQRKIDIQVRNNFTDMLRDNVENPQYGAITNTEYRMFHRDANQMSMQLGTKQVRESMHPIAKNFCQIAELTCIEKVRQLGRKLTSFEANNIMYNIAMGLQVNVDWIQRELGMDVVTGQPLFPKWDKDRNMD